MRRTAAVLCLSLLLIGEASAQVRPEGSASADKQPNASAATQQQADVPAKAESPANPVNTAGAAAGAAEKAPPLEVLEVRLPPDPSPLPDKPTTAAGAAKEEPAVGIALVATLGDSIVLHTNAELSGYLDYAAKQKKAITLFLNGNDTFVTPEKMDRQNNTLQFHLERNSDNKKVWSALLRDPFKYRDGRFVDASVGVSGGTAVRAEPAATFVLDVVKMRWYAWAWLALLIILLAAFIWLAYKYDLLRDGPKPRPWSLGRCQMAWWFFLIIIAYVMIWLISGDQDTIPQSLLALMGISAGTALGAVLIDSTNSDSALSQAATDRLALQAAQQNAQQTLTVAQNAVTVVPGDAIAQKNLADAQAALAVISAKLLAVNNRLNGIVAIPTSRNIVRDILSDSDGTVGLHRFQIAVWTVVLGIIFMVSVTTELTMPVFSTTLLATMGISAGTYLGFKFPEK